MLRGVIYARYSSEKQNEQSIEGQIRENRSYAEKNGIRIVETYIDRAQSAKTDNRPEFQRMIRDSAKRGFDVVIVWKLDGFSRNRYDAAVHKKTLKKNGVKVVCATENIADSPEGGLMEAILEGFAEYYSAELAGKVTRGMTENALKCVYNGGNLPIGYVIDLERHYQLVPGSESLKVHHEKKTDRRQVVCLLFIVLSLRFVLAPAVRLFLLKSRRSQRRGAA